MVLYRSQILQAGPFRATVFLAKSMSELVDHIRNYVDVMLRIGQ